MGYVEENLMPGEQIMYRANLHWIIYAAPLFFGLVGAVFVGSLFGNRYLAALGGLGGLFLIVAGLLGLSRWIISRTSEFAVTNKRVVIKVGLIRRHTLELLLAKVESIGVEQAVLGRILGYGTIVVVGTGGTRESFTNIARSEEHTSELQSRLHLVCRLLL